MSELKPTYHYKYQTCKSIERGFWDEWPILDSLGNEIAQADSEENARKIVDALNTRAPVVPDGWQGIESAPKKRGERIIGWCVFPAGAEWREVKCYTPIDRPDADPTWYYGPTPQNVTHWLPGPAAPKPEGAA